jgi:hypothetical protein
MCGPIDRLVAARSVRTFWSESRIRDTRRSADMSGRGTLRTTASRVCNHRWMKLQDAERVSDRQSLAAFARLLSDDFSHRSRGDDWENLTIDDFLESISGWLEDAPELDDLALPSEAWRVATELLYMGKVYE